MKPLFLFQREMTPLRKLLLMKAACGSKIVEHTVSGAIVTFITNLVAPLKQLVAAINPVQDLHGYDSPWPGAGGKNKCPYMTKENQDQGITTTLNDDGTVVINGATGDGARFYALSSAFEVTAGVSYILSGCPANGSFTSYRLDIRSGSTIDLDQELGTVYDYGSGVTFTPTTTHNIRISVRLGANYTASNLKFYPMVRLASITDATYAPYSNLCPISGWDSANITGTGVNVWDEEREAGGISTGNGADTTTSGYYRTKNYIPVVPNTSYYVKSSISLNIFYYDSEKNYLDWESKQNEIITTPQKAKFVRFRNSFADTWSTYNNDISINYPSTDTQYHPGQVEQIEYAFPQSAGTVYGGTLTIHQDGSGELVVDHLSLTFNGVLDGVIFGTGSYVYPNTETVEEKSFCLRVVENYRHAIGVGLSEKYTDAFASYLPAETFNDINGRIKMGYSPQGNWNEAFIFYIPGCKSKQDYLDYFASKPLQFTFPMLNPVTYQLTNQQVIETLKGVNNIYCDTGDVTVTYYTKG